jgi:chromosome segregation ATPase
MRACVFFLAFSLGLSASVWAQAPQPAGAPDCPAEQAALEADIEVARTKGQMLRRQQLAQTLQALQARCAAATTGQSRATQIQALQERIRDLRKDLDQAEAQLRTLQTAPP